MFKPRTFHTAWLLALPIVLFGVHTAAQADNSSYKPTLFSWFDKPLAVEVEGVTFNLRGSLEQGVVADVRNKTAVLKSRGNLTFAAQKQLRNQLRAHVFYSASYDTRPGSIGDVGGGGDNRKYTDGYLGSLAGVWGKVEVGNAVNAVGAQTARNQYAGNAALAFNGSLGGLNDLRVGYSGRYGPAVLAIELDDEMQADAVLRMSRPIGDKDIGFALRGSVGSFVSNDNSTRFTSRHVMAVADMIYGSSMFDVSLGYENLSSGLIDVDRFYVSAGVQHKIGAISLSAHGHYGLLDDAEEIALALGGRYDIARGLSANLGLNLARLNASNSGVTIVQKNALEAVGSLRYEF